MARRLCLTLHDLTFFTQKFVAFRHDRQRRSVVLFITLFGPQQRTPPRLGKKTRFGDKFAVGNIKVDLAFTEQRIGTKLHQILTRNQIVNVGFTFAQVHLCTARSRNNGVVGIYFFVIPAAITQIGVHHRLRQKIRRMGANRVHHCMTPGIMLFRQIATV